MLLTHRCIALAASLLFASPLNAQSFLHILDGAGDRVGVAGDVDADGTLDIVVGRPYLDFASTDEVGTVQVFSGSTWECLLSLESDAPGSHFGASVSGAGDVNGDGRGDILVGIPQSDAAGIDSGLARVFSGLDGSLLESLPGSGPGDRFGHDVVGLGDVDNDGVGDYSVSAWGTNDYTRVFSGATGTVHFEVPDFGESLDAAGDVNQDGFGDLITGASQYEDGSGTFYGAATVWSGIDGTLIHLLPGEPQVPGQQLFGASVAGLGDATGDGVPDLAVSDLGAAIFSPAGFERVFSGADGSALYDLPAWDLFQRGGRVAGIGDYDGDGLSDVYVAGDWRVFKGTVGTSLAFLDLPDVFSFDPVTIQGTCVGLGDISGDGRDDFVVGLGDNAYVLTGAALPPPDDGLEHHTIFRVETEHFFSSGGVSMAGAGDLNSDGFADVLIGCGFTGPANAGVVLAYSGRDGQLLHEITGLVPSGNLGASVDCAGDVNGDGVPDIVAGAPGSASGAVHVFSGTDGALIHLIAGPAFSELGTIVAGAGDVNADGRDDFLAVSTDLDFVKVFSGLDGSELLHLTSPPPVGNFFGDPATGAGDVNNDGFADIIVGTSSSGGGVPNFAAVFSGQDGALLHYLLKPGLTAGSFGATVARVGDVDQDGFDDVVVGSLNAFDAAPSGGAAYLFSGFDGSLLNSYFGDSSFDQFGSALDGLGDVNGDGLPDLLVGAPGDTTPNGSTGSLQVISLVDGAVLQELGGPSHPNLGQIAASAGDVNGDGRQDILAAAFGTLSINTATILSVSALDFTSDEHELSVSSGGTAQLFLDAGPANAGKLYLVLGSLSGTVPGFTLGFGTLPLNPDVYFFHTLTHPNAFPLTDTLGNLDSDGEATAQFELPVGTFGILEGLVFHHAFLVLDSGTFAVLQVSESTPPLAFVE